MRIWLWAYFLVPSNIQKKTLFKILIFKERSPYGPALKITPLSVVHANISHLRTKADENLALGLIFGPL